MSKICPVCERVYEDEHIFCAADGTSLRGQDAGDDLIGSVIDDRYVIKALLGEGGMGRVYLGEHVHLPRKVAIKVLHARLTSDSAAVARFNREATSTSRIENERVARVFDFGRMAGGATYLAMEYIAGRTLADALDADGALAPLRTSRLIGQVAEGLAAAHRLNIVHRDLKPDNVLIATDDDGVEWVKIVDFGIAKAIGPDDDGTLTAPGYVTGTPEYMSPEQLIGGSIDPRSDVFALGLLAFRCLTNVLPFAPPTAERGFMAAISDAPKRLDAVAPMRQWPSGLQAVFDRVLQRAPADRFPSAVAFADALRDVIAAWERTNEQIHATPTLNAAAPVGGAVAGANVPPRIVVNRGSTPQREARSDANRDGQRDVEGDQRGELVGRHAPDAAAEPAATPPLPVVPPLPPTPTPTPRWLMPVAGGAILVALAVFILRQGYAPASDQFSVIVPPETARASGAGVADSATLLVPSSPRQSSTTTPLDTVAPPRGSATSVTPVIPPRTQSSAAQSPSGTVSGGSPSTRGALAMARLDSVRDALDVLILRDDAGAPVRAAALAERVDGVLAGLFTAGDSARALLLKANALKLSGDRARACTVLNEARPLATATADRNAIRRYAGDWDC